MSDLAVSDTGIKKTASEFHDDHILYDIEYKSFSCPFCEIPLFAKAIYIDGPQGKSPHFSCFKGSPHINGCDGYPTIDGKTTKTTATQNKIKIGKEEFLFPEKLILRRVQNTESAPAIDADEEQHISAEQKVKKRRAQAGKEVGKAKYSSSLIRSFASSYKAILSKCYDYAAENKLNSSDRNKLFKEVLSQAPIDLDGFRTNYQTAFANTRFFSKHSRIWHGLGDLLVNQNSIVIKSTQKCKYETEGEQRELDVYVKIGIPNNLEGLPIYHRTTINRLLNARARESQVKWFSYGKMDIDPENRFLVVLIDNLDHVFIEKLKGIIQ